MLSLSIFVTCVAVILQRRRRGVRVVIPVVVGAIALGLNAMSMEGYAGSFRSIQHAGPADRATILAALIGEALHDLPFALVFWAVVVALALFADRALLRRHANRPN